jgi:hypothetical protein
MFPHLEELDLGNSFLEHRYEMYGSRMPNIKKKLGTPATSPRGEYLLIFSFHLEE